jgi:hypothetical protein
MLVLALIGVGFAMLAMEFQLLTQHFLPWGTHSERLDAALAALNNFAFQVLPAFLGLLLMLAPFVIMARGAGWWRGIVEGLRLLRRYWPAVIAVFIIFRVGWEVLVVWDALSPWETNWATGLSSPPTMLLWSWVGTAALALLGLWVAYALMEIACAPQPAQAESAAQAQA